jgi:hypothetical protein
MVEYPVWKICERVTAVQALIDDHIARGKHSAGPASSRCQRADFPRAATIRAPSGA